MRTLCFIGLLLAPVLSSAEPKQEDLRYEVNWPTGLSLGEAQLKATRDSGRWNAELILDASIPAFKVFDRYRSTMDAKLCSQEFEKEWEHGQRKHKELTTFNGGKAVRKTLPGGGSTELSTPPCARDALAFLFYVRDEVARGRIPAAQKIYFGAPYELRLKLIGTETIKVAQTPTETDHFKVNVQGPASKLEFDVYLARDEARTPALIRVPFVIGTFSMELVR
jgi:hypothetical protein